ncbi:MAG: DoxX family protein [Flavobacteriales bacterium]|nr:DoxX family protein [Flavobacteriales bacterium]
MKYLVLVCRLIVGALFIVSGLIKANDPIGFGIKLDEYFAEDALNLVFLAPYSMALGILACVAEIVLGFAVLFGGRMKLAVAALLWLTIFFGWLTAYTGHCNDMHDAGTPMKYTVVENGETIEKEKHCVSDCGCFGDAMKGSMGRSLTPWESFTKDLILFILIIPIAIASFRKNGLKWNTAADDKLLLPLGLLLVAFFSWVFTWWGPLWFTLIGMAGYLAIKRIFGGHPPASLKGGTKGGMDHRAVGNVHLAALHLVVPGAQPRARLSSVCRGQEHPGAEERQEGPHHRIVPSVQEQADRRGEGILGEQLPMERQRVGGHVGIREAAQQHHRPGHPKPSERLRADRQRRQRPYGGHPHRSATGPGHHREEREGRGHRTHEGDSRAVPTGAGEELVRVRCQRQRLDGDRIVPPRPRAQLRVHAMR